MLGKVKSLLLVTDESYAGVGFDKNLCYFAAYLIRKLGTLRFTTQISC